MSTFANTIDELDAEVFSGDRQMTNDCINDRIQLSVDNGLEVPVMNIVPFVLIK